MRTCPKCQRTYADDLDFCPRDATPLVSAASATQAELETTLGRRFRLVRRLGAGGMGTVFLAEQIAVGNRSVAIKILLRKLIDDPEFLQRFQNEAASTGRIHHGNVVTIYESGQADDGSPYIAMEYLEGESLRQALKSRGSFPVVECVDILQQAARGLNAAHKLGIIHRDLKPDNIFLTFADDDVGALREAPLPANVLVKIVDFGIAKLRESATHTLTGTVLGTPAYMSYEQASGMRSEELDARSDVYSLGIVAYEMLTGRVPFHSDTPLGYVRKHLSEEPPPFRAAKPGLAASPELEKVVMKALAKDRESRYGSVVEFARQFADAARAPQPAASDAPLPSTKIVPPPAGPVREPLPAHPPATTRPTEEKKLERTSPPPPRPEAARTPLAPAPERVEEPRKESRSSSRAPLSAPATPTRRTAPIVLGVMAAIILALAGLWYWWPSGTPPQPEPKNNSTSNNQPASSSGSQKPARSSSTGMVQIPGGTFMMGRDSSGDPGEFPAHSADVAAFSLDKFPVTNAAYTEFVRGAPHDAPPDWNGGTYPTGQDYWPVDHVSWNDAQAYCQWKGEPLPTEAEWEFAARGTDGRLYPWGANFSSGRANSKEAGLTHPEPVGSHPDAASPSGVLDMSGNVWQWVADEYKPYPGGQRFAIPADAKVIRGGSYQSDKDHVTTTTRNLDHASSRSPIIGFRCAK